MIDKTNHYKRLECPNCPLPDTSRKRGKHFVELKTIDEQTFLVAVCVVCKGVQLIPVEVSPVNCGVIRHCGSNNRHKVFVSTRRLFVQCDCGKKFTYALRANRGS